MLILDAGHGVDTPGKRHQFNGYQMFYEWDFNRKVVNVIYDELVKLGYDVIKLIPDEKDMPLAQRVNKANKIYIDNKRQGYLISVHTNAGGGTGWEVFTSPGETKSDLIADVFADKVKKFLPNFRLRVDESDGDLDKEDNFYILKYTNCPAILTENLFMDFLKDYRFLLSKNGVDTIAKLHIAAIKTVDKLYKIK